MKHIVYVIEDITTTGGIRTSILGKSNLFINQGFKVSIISTRISSNTSASCNSSKINYINLGIERESYSKAKYLSKLKVTLENQLSTIEPTHIFFLMDRGLKIYPKIKTTAKKIIEIHGSYDFYRNYLAKKNSFIRKIIKLNRFRMLKVKLNNFDLAVILFESDRVKWNLKNSVTIPNFIREITTTTNGRLNNKHFMAAGRLSYEKGFDMLIMAWEKIVNKGYNFNLSIYGSGPEIDNLNKLINKLNLHEHVKIMPFTSNLDSLFNDYQAIIIPSRYEAFPMIALESLSHNVPVISFETESGIKEIITNEVDGLLTSLGNIEQLSDNIIRMSDRDFRASLAKNAEVKVAKYSAMNVLKCWNNLLNS
ncbi:glycosyltransferase family 4 protein [Shewanella sp. SNU WT4]|uniref:glycosyltransferase n=1 Tax=Shewanella sp. SNU WT4 TaxID=2590015 RepID=UPI0011261873|nr:glycosyltransferase [Shewanella sp. SNU WT4]QDF65627.1 glycosyltransferase family 4 protein [Shewanella sp. SNU WT4]